MSCERVRRLTRRFVTLLVLAVATACIAGVTPAMASTAFPGTGPWPGRVTYYVVNDGVNFTRSLVPYAAGVATQSVAGGAVTMSINNATGYADSGVVFYDGRLGDLPDFTINGSGTAYSVNLWFDTNNDGEYFAWLADVFTGVAGDTYGLGPASSGTLAVNGTSAFGMMTGTYGPYSLAQLKAGIRPDITADTRVAIWLGIAGTGPRSATLAPVTCSVTASAGANGVVSPATQSVCQNDTATVSVTADPGYYCSSLLVNGSPVAPASSCSFVVTSDGAVSASFSPLAPVEHFAHNPVIATTKTAGAWYTDRYAPAGFAKAAFDGDSRLRVSISSADSLANRPVPYQSTFYNTQGRKYDLGGATFVAGDLYVGSDWDVNNRRSDLWVTAIDAGGAATGYPIIGFVNGTGFRVWDNLGWHTIGFPADFSYGKWYNLRMQLNPGRSVSYYIDGALVYESLFTADADMAACTGFDNLMVQAYNFGESYDAYWDNVAPVPAAGYTIATNAGANGTITPANPSFDGGETATLTITPNTGYHVSSVSVDGSSIGVTGTVVFTNISANHTVDASFAIDRYQLHYAAGANGTISGTASQTVDYLGSGSAVTATPNTGYHFVSWSDGLLTAARTDSGVVADLNVTASFAINTYTIVPSAGANGSISPSTTQTVNYGATPGFTMTPALGYNVATLTVDGSPVTAATSYTFAAISANHTIAVTFADKTAPVSSSDVNTAYLNTATIRLTATDAASGVAHTYYKLDGGSQVESSTITVSSAGAHSIEFWSVDAAGNAEVHKTANLTITDTLAPTTASDAVATYTGSATIHLTPTDNAGGSGVAGTFYVLDGGSPVSGRTVTTSATGSHTLEFWSVDVEGNEETPHKSVAFSVAAVTFNITASAGANGSILPSGVAAIVSGSDSATYTITPSAGYHIADVLVDGSSVGPVSAYKFSNVTAAHTIAASFAVNPPVMYTITASAGANGAVSPASQQVDAGGTATVTITPDTGYHIDTVTIDGASAPTASPVVLTNVSGPHTVAATFAANSVSLIPTTITIKTNATTAKIGNIPILSGAVTPAQMIGVNIVCYVKKPGKVYWSYSSNRTVYLGHGAPAWQYKYYFKKGMTKGTYIFKAVAPAPGFASSAPFATSTSPTTVSIKLR